MQQKNTPTKPPLNWLPISVFSISAIITLFFIPYYALTHGFDGWQIAAMLIGIFFCEISITAGYHRLWSHRAYEAHWLVRLFFAIGGTYAVQNTILHWSSDHRIHHTHVDNNEKDPYSAKRGFWYSHMGWMIREYNLNPNKNFENCKDLKKDPIVMFQHKHYLPLVLGLNFGIPILLGLWHGDLIGMMLLAGVARLTISHHLTFFINSLAHVWGSQPYSDKNTSRDNPVIALLTFGEGYHNYHHSFQRDYRNAIRWWQYDPTKWLIRSLSIVGLAKGLYRTPLEYIEIERAQMLLKNTTLKLSHRFNSEALTLRLQEEYDTLIKNINAFTQAKRQWMEARKNSMVESYDIDILKERVEVLKENLLQQKKNWLNFNARIVPA
ncbi:MAG: acyl-CoA desaturase [endosymbiont of Galathealinum brachiosum]|uniref:Acyl-CoA desaturase n=1 Tax=endosymbiont of Galathealinum brachiosum TaxID=2200906 RepID=A0A370DLC9_9GAMM|nr:MAG: acyl-CoA desaturase [endosymbiont of Galathealinum brachiosum]